MTPVCGSLLRALQGVNQLHCAPSQGVAGAGAWAAARGAGAGVAAVALVVGRQRHQVLTRHVAGRLAENRVGGTADSKLGVVETVPRMRF